MTDLLDWEPPTLPSPRKDKAFDGPAYDPKRDHARLRGQILRVFDLMKDEVWRTLDEIADQTGDPHASVSAQLRHLRKEKYGKHTVEREHEKDGLHRYRLLVREATDGA